MFSVAASRRFLLPFALALIVMAATTVLLYVFFSPRIELLGIAHQLFMVLKKPSAPLLFIMAMILLPPFGVPISFFLALAGLHFGVVGGMLLTFFVLPIHMIICYAVTQTFFRAPLKRFLARRGYKIPFLQTRRPGLAMFGFLLMPGPPYVLKTYLLAMTELPFHRFLFFNWGTETLITLPIVAMTGAAAEKNWTLFGIALFIFGLSLGLRWYEKKKSTNEGKS